jgi:hypothetical protein
VLLVRIMVTATRAVRDASGDGTVLNERERDVWTDQLQEGIEVIDTEKFCRRELLEGLLTAIDKGTAIVAARDDGQIVFPEDMDTLLHSTNSQHN